MRLIAFDTETDLIRSGLVAPPMVCLSWADSDGSHLLDARDARAWFSENIVKPGILWIGANVAYDMAVMMNECPATVNPVFRAYAEGRVSDVAIRQSLINNARGTFLGFPPSLTDLEKEHGVGDRSAQKSGFGEDVWRMRYAELADVPLAEWPPAARAYPIADADGTMAVWLSQARLRFNTIRQLPMTSSRPPSDIRGTKGGGHNSTINHAVVVDGMVVNEGEQTRASIAMHLMSCWGLMVDQGRLAELTQDLEDAQSRLKVGLLQEGLLVETATGDKADGTVLFERIVGALTSKATVSERSVFQDEMARREAAHDLEGAARKAANEEARGLAKAAVPKLKMPPLFHHKPVSETVRQQNVIAAWRAAGVNLPATDTGRIKKGQDVLEVVEDDGIARLVKYEAIGKKLSTFVAPLRDAGYSPLTARINTMVESGRASSSKPNLMNLPREGGERECLVARPGHYIVSTDYATIELRAWAQVCKDAGISSTMLVALNEGRDLHAQLGAVMSGVCYETFMTWLSGDEGSEKKALAKKLRAVAKPANFGLPVGMGVTSFKSSARKSYGVDFDKDASLLPAPAVIEAWNNTWTEAPAYFSWIESGLKSTGKQVEQKLTRRNGSTVTIMKDDKRGAVVHPRSGRARGGCMFTEAANTYFQGMAADAFKASLFALSAECYAVPSSPLYGARLLAPIHDEVLMEVRDDRVQAATDRMIEVMESCGRRYMPDVPIVAEPAIMRRWSKSAESKRGADGLWTVVENL